MSHWVEKKANFKDVEALAEACKMLGLQLDQNARARGWSGATIKADYVIKLDGSYDVALVKNGDSYDITADWFDGSVARAIGREGNKLKQAYTAAATLKVARAQGHAVEMQRVDNGEIKLILKVGARG